MFLLDTNVLSELVLPRPHPAVVRRILAAPEGSLHASEVSRYELRFGALLHPLPDALWARIQALVLPVPVWVPVAAAVSEGAGRIAAQLRRAGRPADAIDPFIAATALVLGCPVVTRNTRHFEAIDGLRILDWHED
ncbi:MAG: type II toxin-antitoxin system VapC family toxin [Burkholderiales bacterium]|jgi:predicted nucleic acid-binding protein|nr:type II toxin-antitoxin system VapC family toxin [Burkholderiales bacterium]